MNIKGIIVYIYTEKVITDSFKKREFVIEYAENPEYPEYLKFEAIQDKCALLDKFKDGQEIDVYFNLKGRKWDDPKGGVKYFNTLQAWKIEGNEQQPATENSPEWVEADHIEDDLPF